MLAEGHGRCHICAMFRAQIVLVEPHGPDDSDGMPPITIPESVPTIAEAEKIARFTLKLLQRPAGTAYFRIIDDHGNIY